MDAFSFLLWDSKMGSAWLGLWAHHFCTVCCQLQPRLKAPPHRLQSTLTFPRQVIFLSVTARLTQPTAELGGASWTWKSLYHRNRFSPGASCGNTLSSNKCHASSNRCLTSSNKDASSNKCPYRDHPDEGSPTSTRDIDQAMRRAASSPGLVRSPAWVTERPDPPVTVPRPFQGPFQPQRRAFGPCFKLLGGMYTKLRHCPTLSPPNMHIL